MITQNYHENIESPLLLNKYCDLDKILFFDIETTGLSPKNSFVYLISAGYFKNNKFFLTQFFAESAKEELLILDAFEKTLDKFTVLAQFNGNRFDIPYLKDRFKYHGLASYISTMEPLDIYLYTKQYKKLFNTENCKLKTFERLLNINRKDLIDGGEAINEYYNFISTGDKYSLNACLLHNYEDVLNLPKLSELIIIEQLKKLDDYDFKTYFEHNDFVISVDTKCHMDLTLSYEYDDLKFTYTNNIASLRFNIIENVIRLHYSNYKKYVFLNKEKYAIESGYAKTFCLKDVSKCNIHTAYQPIDLNSLKKQPNEDIIYLWNESYGWLLQTLTKKTE